MHNRDERGILHCTEPHIYKANRTVVGLHPTASWSDWRRQMVVVRTEHNELLYAGTQLAVLSLERCSGLPRTGDQV